MLWGLQKTRPLWIVNLQDAAEDEDGHQQQPGQLFNPPLVHCVSVASCGNVVGCAAEDGRVHLMRIGSGSRVEQQGWVKAHAQGASQASFPGFLSHPYWLLTGGNDGQVTLWDLSRHPVVSPETKARPAAGRKGKTRAKRKVQDKSKNPEAEKDGAEEEGGAAAGSEEAEEQPGPKLSISHGDKINWLCPTLLRGEASVVVADQSSSLTIYPLTGL